MNQALLHVLENNLVTSIKRLTRHLPFAFVGLLMESGFSCPPQKTYVHVLPLPYLWMWPYLKIGPVQMSLTKDRKEKSSWTQGCPRKGGDTERDTQGTRKMGGSLPRSKEGQEPPEAGRIKERFSHQNSPSKGAGPASSLVLGLWPQERWGNQFLLCEATKDVLIWCSSPWKTITYRSNPQ